MIFLPSFLLMFGAMIGALNVLAGLYFTEPPLNPPSEPYRTSYERKYIDPYK